MTSPTSLGDPDEARCDPAPGVGRQHRMRALMSLVLATSLAACSFWGSDRGAQRIEIGGQVFLVERGRTAATVRNDSQGVVDSGRLYLNAEAAVVMATGCDVTRMTQRIGANVYDADLDCPVRAE